MPVQKAKSANPIDREYVASRLYEIGRDQLRLESVQTEMQAEIEAVKKRFANRIEKLTSTIDERARRLRLECEDSRPELLSGKAKSLKTLFGVVGWRTQGESVILDQGVKGDEAAQRAIERGLDALVRIKQEIDKPAVKSALDDGEITDADLKALGLKIRPGGEDWYYKLALDEVREAIRQQQEG